MNLNDHGKVEARFAAYVDGLSSVIGHVRRTRQLRDYCTGLVLPGERKSVKPMAARTAPGRTAAQHQSLLPRGKLILAWTRERVDLDFKEK
jgi:SRSO17 transposase